MDEITTTPIEPEPAPLPASPPAPPSPPDPAARRWRIGFGVALAVSLALIVSQVVLITTLRTTNDELTALGTGLGEMETAVGDVAGSVDGLEGQVADVGDRITSLEAQRLALAPGPNSTAPGPSPAAVPEDEVTTETEDPPEGITIVASRLPRFDGNSGTDPALGMTLGEVAGFEYYSGTTASYSPDDGLPRAILVWAHWCPYCQDEMPVIADWIDANGAEFTNMEIVSVTTAMDEGAPNPLLPYLDDNQWPFPVLVDDTGALASQLGVNAFPFWVFTGADGTVLGRTAGLLPIEQLDGIFRQLEDLGAQA